MAATFPNGKPARRWYDRIKKVPEAIELTQHFPGPVQNTVIEILNDTIEHYRRLRKNHQQSAGINKILGLFQASKRSRWYDIHPRLRRAFNMMALVPMEPLSSFAEQIIGIGQLMEIQQAEHLLPDVRHLEQQAEAILKKTYYTFIEDPRGIRVVQNDFTGEPNDEIRAGRIIVPPKTSRPKYPHSKN